MKIIVINDPLKPRILKHGMLLGNLNEPVDIIPPRLNYNLPKRIQNPTLIAP